MVSTAGLVVVLIDSVVCGFDGMIDGILIVCGFNGGIDGDVA